MRNLRRFLVYLAIPPLMMLSGYNLGYHYGSGSPFSFPTIKFSQLSETEQKAPVRSENLPIIDNVIKNSKKSAETPSKNETQSAKATPPKISQPANGTQPARRVAAEPWGEDGLERALYRFEREALPILEELFEERTEVGDVSDSNLGFLMSGRFPIFWLAAAGLVAGTAFRYRNRPGILTPAICAYSLLISAGYGVSKVHTDNKSFFFPYSNSIYLHPTNTIEQAMLDLGHEVAHKHIYELGSHVPQNREEGVATEVAYHLRRVLWEMTGNEGYRGGFTSEGLQTLKQRIEEGKSLGDESSYHVNSAIIQLYREMLPGDNPFPYILDGDNCVWELRHCGDKLELNKLSS